MSMISVTLPDGSVNEYASGITAGEIVIDIEGRKHDCVAALVDGEQKDFSATLDSDCSVEGISGFTNEGIHILRHSAAHLLAQAVTRFTLMRSQQLVQQSTVDSTTISQISKILANQN